MQKLERKKKYKDKTPKETVEYIKSLLNKYDIEVIEKYHHVESADVSSCRIYISNHGLKELNIGTNGKGMDKEYSLASAYGEFMERLANNFLLPSVTVNHEGLVYLDKKEAKTYIKDYCQSAFGENEILSDYYLKSLNEDKVPFLIFDDVFNNVKTYMPINLVEYLTGSNGMCAGNSKNEAIIQGISEIFERATLYEIMMNDVVLPEIDKQYFKSSVVYENLEQINKLGYKYRILDASLGKGYPVIGLIIYHGNEYQVRFGSDPSPVTALERCLTEIFQGFDNIVDYPFKDIEQQKLLQEAYQGTKEQFRYEQFYIEHQNGTGYYPLNFVDENSTPSYKFEGFKHTVSYSNEDDLSYYFEIIKQNNKKLYISDRSSLDFPVYFCLIPSLSETLPKNDNGKFFVDRMKCLKNIGNITKIHSLNKEELLKLAACLEKWFSLYTSEKNINYLFEYCSFNIWHKDKLIAYIYACAGNKDKANEYLTKYFMTNIGKYDKQLFVRKLVEEGNIDDCFPKQEWPLCPNCDKCLMKNKCHLEDINNLSSCI